MAAEPATAAARIPLIVGFNHDEQTFFAKEHPEVFRLDEATLISAAHKALGAHARRILSVYKSAYPKASPTGLYIAIGTAVTFGNDTIRLAERKSAQPAPVYVYRYDYRSNYPVPGTDWTLRAGHAPEIAMKFSNADIPALEGNGPGAAATASNMSQFWTRFARTGQPDAPGLPTWSRYDLNTRATMIIDAQCHMENDPDHRIRELWASLPDSPRRWEIPGT